MSTHRNIERVCCAALALALLAAALFCFGERLGLQRSDRAQGYEARLFDTTRVHTIDIVMDDWEGFLETCENEEYQSCAVVVDNEAYKNVALRAKGNTSLSMVSSYGNDRYSFKIEFDHYDAGNTYYGLDKLCLNNIIQDNTYMKDYLAYTLMRGAGVASPLCSFVYLTVNGEGWGLYLAVEAVEDAFLSRNYGRDSGNLYKPDSTGAGGGRGNGRDFNMDNFLEQMEDGELPAGMENGGFPAPPEGMPTPPDGFGQMGLPNAPGDGGGRDPDGAEPDPDASANGGHDQSGSPPGQSANADVGPAPEGAASSPDADDTGGNAAGAGEARPERGARDGFGGGGPGGMGSNDVKLQYIDDDPDSYPNIFDNAKTDITTADQARLIASLKQLGEQEDLESVVSIDEAIRYFAVHDFLCNDDSYTGSIVHNYYLYEKDGVLSMIPWDYNLSFGTMGGGSDASSAVNSPIDSPAGGSESDRPMVAWIFSNAEYTEKYHAAYAQLVSSLTEGDYLAELIRTTAERIAPYVETDPTKFCTYEEFQAGVETLLQFCALRLESIAGQLDGSIPSTSDGQRADASALIDASAIDLSEMGSMHNPGGNDGGFGGDRGGFGDKGAPGRDGTSERDDASGTGGTSEPDGSSTSDTAFAPNDIMEQDGASDRNGRPETDGDAFQNDGASPTANADRSGEPSREGGASPESGMTLPTEGGAPSDTAGANRQPAPGFDGTNRGFANEPQTDAASGSDMLLLLGVSLAVLFAGLAIALKFKR